MGEATFSDDHFDDRCKDLSANTKGPSSTDLVQARSVLPETKPEVLTSADVREWCKPYYDYITALLTGVNYAETGGNPQMQGQISAEGMPNMSRVFSGLDLGRGITARIVASHLFYKDKLQNLSDQKQLSSLNTGFIAESLSPDDFPVMVEEPMWYAKDCISALYVTRNSTTRELLDWLRTKTTDDSTLAAVSTEITHPKPYHISKDIIIGLTFRGDPDELIRATDLYSPRFTGIAMSEAYYLYDEYNSPYRSYHDKRWLYFGDSPFYEPAKPPLFNIRSLFGHPALPLPDREIKQLPSPQGARNQTIGTSFQNFWRRSSPEIKPSQAQLRTHTLGDLDASNQRGWFLTPFTVPPIA